MLSNVGRSNGFEGIEATEFFRDVSHPQAMAGTASDPNLKAPDSHLAVKEIK